VSEIRWILEILDESVSPGSLLLKYMLISSGKWKFVGLKIINLDFFGCTPNPFALYQEDSLISSVFTDETKFSKFESERIDEMSSANKIDLRNSEQLDMSFIEIKNRITPKIEPWITPIFKLEVFSDSLAPT